MDKKQKKQITELKIEKLLTSWGVIVILWSIFRSSIPLPVWFSELIAKPLIFILPVYWFVSKNEKMGHFWAKIGFPKKGLVKELLLTLLLMVLIIGFGFLSLLTSQGVKIVFINQIDLSHWGSLLGLAFLSAFSEEIVGRGFLFNYLLKYSKSFMLSLFVSSTLFFVLYLPGALTLNMGGMDLVLNLLLNFMLSFVTAIAFYLRKNLLPAIGVHAIIVFWFDLLLQAN
jgi:membrane protease YdiL (CAAX protease family)